MKSHFKQNIITMLFSGPYDHINAYDGENSQISKKKK